MRRPFALVSIVLASLLLLGGLGPHPRSAAPANAAGEFRQTLTGLAADTPPRPLPFVTPAGVRSCDYLVGFSEPAKMPAEVVNAIPPGPPARPARPGNTPVPAGTTAQQLSVFDGLWNGVNDNYVAPDFHGVDWEQIRTEYMALIEGGLTEADFGAAMDAMIGELGDEHSRYQTAQEAADEDARLLQGQNFVGIGALVQDVPGTEAAVIIVIFPGSPAAAAGLRSHDIILKVDGGPVRDSFGVARTRGPAGSPVTITVSRPGEAARDVVLIRQAVSGFIPIDYCLVPATRIGYIFVPTLLDPTIDDQVRTALQKLTADGPLWGLVLDFRENGGGSSAVVKPLLGFLLDGLQGAQVSRTGAQEFRIAGEDVGGSQSVPLVVLVDWNTVSFAEIGAGVLEHAGRATIVGRTTLGNVENLARYDFSDGSRAWIATFTFQPVGMAAGVWEETGIVPSVVVPTRWDLFTEATDPALAVAVGLLLPR